MKRLNLNFIVGKRQIVLSALVMCLSLAVYINWAYSNEVPEYFEPVDIITETTSPELSEVDTTVDEVKNYGDSEYVAELEGTEAYFAEAKVNRQKNRDEVTMTLTELIESEDISTDQKAQLAMKVSELADTIESEGKIENLIKAKGFTECMVYYDTNKVDVIVESEGLEAAEVAQMKDIIMKEVSVPVENIAIIEIN